MTDHKQPVEFASLDRLFFHLYQGLGPESNPDAELSQFFESIGSLGADVCKQIREKVKSAYDASARAVIHPGLVDLFPDGGLPDNHRAYLLHDTLILEINMQVQNEAVSLLRHECLAPKDCLGSISLLIVAANDQTDDSAKEFCAESLGVLQEKLALVSKATLKDWPIWEFVHDDSSCYVWIMNSFDDKLIDAELLLDLFCCRAKIEYVVKAAAKTFFLAKKNYQSIEDRLAEISRQPLAVNSPNERKQRIECFETSMAILPHNNYKLAGHERDLEAHLLTLQDNIANALQSCSQLLSDGDTFMRDEFLLRQCVTYERQIQHDLKVLTPGRRYADQAIDAIRTMVTLDTQKDQLELERKENAREENLRKTAAIVGSGLTISGLAASSRTRPSEKLLKTPPTAILTSKPAVLWLADIGIFAGLGLIAAFVVYVAWNLTGALISSLKPRDKLR